LTQQIEIEADKAASYNSLKCLEEEFSEVRIKDRAYPRSATGACTCLTPGVESRKPSAERSKGDESTKEEVSVGRKRDDEGLQDWEKDRDQDRQEEHDEREEVRQEEHDEREQVRREEREDRKQAREDERETRRRSP
jgi:hypothetical protein